MINYVSGAMRGLKRVLEPVGQKAVTARSYAQAFGRGLTGGALYASQIGTRDELGGRSGEAVRSFRRRTHPTYEHTNANSKAERTGWRIGTTLASGRPR